MRKAWAARAEAILLVRSSMNLQIMAGGADQTVTFRVTRTDNNGQ
jgi:hypothetical protein